MLNDKNLSGIGRLRRQVLFRSVSLQTTAKHFRLGERQHALRLPSVLKIGFPNFRFKTMPVPTKGGLEEVGWANVRSGTAVR
jgi:hypothetical protein